MRTYQVKIDVQSLIIEVEANSSDEAIELAETQFNNDARSIFYIEDSQVLED